LGKCGATLFTEQLEEDSLRGSIFSKRNRVRQLAPCIQACPLKQDVPGYLGAIADNDYDRALQIIFEDNPFGSVCSRLCFHPCSQACTRQSLDGAVAIRELKMAAVEGARKTPRLDIPAANRGRVAVIGAGPAGLSVAFFLRRQGWSVIVFEAAEQAGGLLRYAVPSFDLSLKALDADLERIMSLGIELQTNSSFSKQAEIEGLLENGFDAVVLAVGAGQGSRLDVDGTSLKNSLDGMSFVRACRAGQQQKISGSVVVAGGGHLAITCARIAVRLGAKSVNLVMRRNSREVPAYAERIRQAEEEGVEIVAGTRPQIEIPTDLLVSAEQRVLDPVWNEWPQLLSKVGTVRLEQDSLMTVTEGVFAAGEAATGQRNLVASIAHGRRVAKAVERFLEGKGL
jgi:NADH-quinone oxidoreductase subunit F